MAKFFRFWTAEAIHVGLVTVDVAVTSTVLVLVAKVVTTTVVKVDVLDTGVACKLQADERMAEGYLVKTSGVDNAFAERFACATVVVTVASVTDTTVYGADVEVLVAVVTPAEYPR